MKADVKMGSVEWRRSVVYTACHATDFDGGRAPIPALRTLCEKMFARVPTILVGDPGQVKTAGVRMLAKAMSYQVVVLLGSTMEASDVSGYPLPVEVVSPEGTRTVTKFAPRDFQVFIEQHPRTLLFLDEIGDAHPSVQSALQSMIQDRAFIDGTPFPEETYVVGAMNPSATATNSYEMGKAFGNRMSFVEWSFPDGVWLRYLVTGGGVELSEEGKKVRAFLAAFLDEHRYQINNPSNERDSAGDDAEGGSGALGAFTGASASREFIASAAFPSNRSWENLAKVLTSAVEMDPGAWTAAVIEQHARDTVGEQATRDLMIFFRSYSSLDVQNVLRHPEKYDMDFFRDLKDDDVKMLLSQGIEQMSTPMDVVRLAQIFTVFVAPESKGGVDKPGASAGYLKRMVEAYAKAGKISWTRPEDEIRLSDKKGAVRTLTPTEARDFVQRKLLTVAGLYKKFNSVAADRAA